MLRLLKWPLRLAAAALLLAGGIFAAATFYPEIFLCMDTGPGKAEVIVVLGGGLHERPERAAELFRWGAAPRIIVTGAGDDQINRQLLIANGVPDRLIEIEGGSQTTRENALFTIERLRAAGIRDVILVTSWYHARRTLKTFRHYAPDIRFQVRPSYYGFDRAAWGDRGNGRRMRLEFLKLAGYWVRYGISPF